jgi:hypothetical protein
MTEKIDNAKVIYEPEGGGFSYFVRVPKNISKPYEPLRNTFGFIAITAKIGSTSWPTSLLSAGDKESYFISVPAKIRKAESINAGDVIDLEFEPRER